jgi:chemosensory pili system protein ChpA (sensor histidine kinase/response regulator)
VSERAQAVPDPDADRRALLEVFFAEARETLWTLAAGARRLAAGRAASTGPDDLALVVHRLKGSAALYGFSALSELAGLLEDVLAPLRGAPAEERKRASELVAAFVEFLRAMLKQIEASGVEDAGGGGEFRARHAAWLAPPPEAVNAGDGEQIVQELDRFYAGSADVVTYFGAEAAEHLEVMTQAMAALDQPEPDEQAVPVLLRAAHTLKGAAYTVGCAPVGALAHRLEDLLVGIRDKHVPLSSPAIDGLAAGLAALRAMLALDAGPRGSVPALLEHARAALDGLALASSSVKTAPASRPDGEDDGRERAARPARPTVRVPVDCLDALVDLVGEFVVGRSRRERRLEELRRVDELLSESAARLTRVVQSFHLKHEYAPVGVTSAPVPEGRSLVDLFEELEFDRYSDFNVLARSAQEVSADVSEIRAQLARVLHDLEDDEVGGQRLVRGLRREVMRARMVPFGRLFARFPRQVREASRAAGKGVALQVTGTAVEIDSAIIAELADPLLHLVQNAVAHGVETEDERRAAGKPAEGTIHVRAHHESAAVFVEVEDDGRGIDVEALRAQAVSRGLVTPDAAPLLSEPEILNLIFLPGFTTAPQVTPAAGRGIGLDVVRTNVARINGDVEVTTRPGAGTRFTIRIPVTVLISDALLLGAGGETFAVPLNAVKQVMTVRPERIQAVNGKEMVWVEDRLVDLIRLDRYLALPPSAPRRELPLLVLRSGRRPLVLAVDDLYGKEEIVIKPLGGFPEGLGPFSSGTVDGDGWVILVLNPARLLDATGAAPARSAAEARIDAEAAPPHTRPASAAETTRRFLLVDDSISVRKFVGQMLERAGFSVATASDGADALQQLETTAIHAVITDLEMPNVNGYELIENLRRRPSTRDLPIVILTTRGGDKHQELARRLGVKHYLTKPVEEAAFVDLVGSLVARPLAGDRRDGPR